MSLINDALKRARQTQQENPPPPPALEFKAADPSQRRGSGPPTLLIGAVVVILALVGVFLVIAFQKRGTVQSVENMTQPQVADPSANPVSQQQSAPAPVQSRPAAAITPSLASVVAGPATNQAAATGNPIPSNNAASTDSGTNVTNATVDPPPKPAAPKLQGIFYRPTRPSAVISGKNVFIGSRVGEFKVRVITPESVTIVSETQTNVLSLEQ